MNKSYEIMGGSKEGTRLSKKKNFNEPKRTKEENGSEPPEKGDRTWPWGKSLPGVKRKKEKSLDRN